MINQCKALGTLYVTFLFIKHFIKIISISTAIIITIKTYLFSIGFL